MRNTNDVYREVARRSGLSLMATRKIIDGISDTIAQVLNSGEEVKIANFGRFRIHHYPSKSVPDPKGRGHQILVLPTKVIKFKPADKLRNLVETRRGQLHKHATRFDENGAEITTPPDEVDQIQSEKQPADEAEFVPDEVLADKVEEEAPVTGGSEPIIEEETVKKTPNLLILFDKFKKRDPKQNLAQPSPTDPATNSNLYKQAIKPKTVAYKDLSSIRVGKNVLNILPELFARRHKAAPIEADKNSITVAMVDPENLETVQLIKKSTGRDVIPVLATTEDINRILNQYSGLEKEVETVIKDTELGISKKEIVQAQAENVEVSGDDSPTSRIVLSLLRRAVREKASDIHIEPYEDSVAVRFRVDGVLRMRIKLPKTIQAAIIARLKIIGNLKIDEHRLPQDGRFMVEIDKNPVDFRLSILPVADGEKAVMRVLDKSQGILSLEEIGVRGRSYDIVKKNIKKSFGMTLVCGPTGSGKTTTLYALLGQLMDVGVNIVTLENPIEYRIEGINQSQVNPDIDYDFADGLRAIVRQDPDIIMVGEIRDKPTAEIAIQSALTGHIVLSTLHTNNAAGSFPRLIDMGVEPFLISSSINTVIAQRLARKVCDHCKEPYNPSSQELQFIKEEIAKIREFKAPAKMSFVKGKGCEICNGTGYSGRIGLFEILDVNNNVKELVNGKSDDSKIAQQAINDGMTTMLQDGILKALDNLTTLEEVWRVTKD